MIISNCTDLKEHIEYTMLCYRINDKSEFHLNTQMAYVSLYVGDINKVPNSETLSKEFDVGKGCIRIRKNINLPENKLEEFIAKTILL